MNRHRKPGPTIAGFQGNVLSDIQRLFDRFAGGSLILPSEDRSNLIDFSLAVATCLGVQDVQSTAGAAEIGNVIGRFDHLVLVLADGFGMNFVECMDPTEFIPQHVVAELVTVFPSTTPVVLTSLTTGRWPGEHAVLGWETYLPEISDVSTIIKFVRAADERPLSELGITPEQAYPVPSMFRSAGIDALFLYPEYIVDSAYSNYWTGGLPQAGYKHLAQAVDAIVRRVQTASGPTFTYLYAPHVDSTAHEFGTGHANTLANVKKVNHELGRLAKNIPGRSRVVMTADHGLLDARPDEVHVIEASDELGKRLRVRPSGDSRVRHFHMDQDEQADFSRLFMERFGERFVLLSAKEIEDSNLFGPHPLTPATRSRMADLTAISLGSDVIAYRTVQETEAKSPKVSHHSGLSPAELRVPLVIA